MSRKPISDPSHRETRYSLSSGIRIAADVWGDVDCPSVILMHGGGQTRHAWGGTALALARAGFHAISLDLRGHGDSDWDPRGEYVLEAYVEDLREIGETLPSPPALVGASLGGMIALLSQAAMYPGTAAALVMVDIAPRMEQDGVARIVGFMQARPDGYASLEEAADAVAEFLPHRERPADLSGLEKNLKRGEDGRYRWHWDPRFLDVKSRQGRGMLYDVLKNAARRLTLPTLLVRGRMSDVLSEDGAREFLELVPHAEYVDVRDAAHMVAGDRNDAFCEAVVEFLDRTVAAVRPDRSREGP